MRGWGKIVLGLTMLGGVLALDAYLANKKEIVHRAGKKQAKRALAAQYQTSSLTSQAVFILPPCGEADDDAIKAYAFQIRDILLENDIPAFVIGDTSGTATVKSIQQNIKAIQQIYHFDAVTVLNLAHGCVSDDKTRLPFSNITMIRAAEAWDRYPERTNHLTVIHRGPSAPRTSHLMESMVAAAQVRKMDWFSTACYAGAVNQRIVDLLPLGSTFVALSGGGQVNYFDAQKTMLKKMRQGWMQFDEGVDGTDLLVEALQENWREYNADVKIGVSGGDALAVIPGINRDNTFDGQAAAGNARQMETVKKTKFRKRKPH